METINDAWHRVCSVPGRYPEVVPIAAVSQWEKLTDKIILVGQGENDGRDCIVVEVKCDPIEVADIIPATFQGYDVIVRQTPDISAGG